MQRQMSFRLFSLLLLHLTGNQPKLADASSFSLLPTTTTTVTDDVTSSRGNPSRDCQPGVPGCLCVGPIDADNYFLIADVRENSTIEETWTPKTAPWSVPSSANASNWTCSSIFVDQLQEFIDPWLPERIESITDLSIWVDSNLFALSSDDVASILCRFHNVRRLVLAASENGVTTVNDAVLSVVKPINDCLRHLNDLTVKQSHSNHDTMQLFLRLLHHHKDQSVDGAQSGDGRLHQLSRIDLSDNNIDSFDVELLMSSQLEPRLLDLSGNRLSKLMNTKTCRRVTQPWHNDVTPSIQRNGSDVDTNEDDMKVTTDDASSANDNDNNVCNETETNLRAAALWSLNVSRNRIDHIGVGFFDFRFRNLATLDLSYNSLQTIVNGTFADLYSLHTINLSHNNIAEIHAEAFATTETLVLSSSNNENGNQTGRDLDNKETADREEQYYIRLASCTDGWLDIQVKT